MNIWSVLTSVFFGFALTAEMEFINSFGVTQRKALGFENNVLDVNKYGEYPSDCHREPLGRA